MITLTPAAIEAVKLALSKHSNPDSMFRIGLKGGGCSGFSYVFEISNSKHIKDHVFEFDGVKVLVDPKSIIYLSGSILDWEKTLIWSGFKFKNPHEKTSCGCGQSFGV